MLLLLLWRLARLLASVFDALKLDARVVGRRGRHRVAAIKSKLVSLGSRTTHESAPTLLYKQNFGFKLAVFIALSAKEGHICDAVAGSASPTKQQQQTKCVTSD